MLNKWESDVQVNFFLPFSEEWKVYVLSEPRRTKLIVYDLNIVLLLPGCTWCVILQCAASLFMGFNGGACIIKSDML